MKLELKHIAPYLPYEVNVEFNRKIYPKKREYQVLTINTLRLCEEAPSKFSIKPLLRPLSDLYKEIDGKVGIVELAKIHDPDFDDTEAVTVTPSTGWSTMGHVDYWNNDGIECRFGCFNSFQAGYINPTRHRFVSNQLDLFAYLFLHHYDVFSLIPQNLAIDINEIK